MEYKLIIQNLVDKITNIEKELTEIKYLLFETNNNKFKPFDESWEEWIKINIQNGVNKNDIFNILLNYNFSYEQIQIFLNWEPTINYISERKKNKKNIILNNDFKIEKFNKTLQDNPKVVKIENFFLDIYKIYNFLSEDECNDLIQSFQNEKFVRSTITSNNENNENNENNKIRTSSTFHLFSENNKLYFDLNDKICKTIGLNEIHSEISQVQKYIVGEEFKEHTDYFDENLEYNKKYIGERGQRTWTFMIYLNGVEEGGETNFPKLNLKIQPIRGMALIWNNLINDENVNPYSLHQGMPILKGQKIIITKWFRKN